MYYQKELTMRAIAIDAYKTQPHLQEVPRPQPGEGEILIRLHAAGVNPMDWRARDGTYQQWWPAEFPAVLGFDGAGVVEQVGAGVSAFQPGDAVLDVATRDPEGLSHISQALRAGGRLLTAIVTTEAPRLAEQGINAALLSWQPSAELLGRIARFVDAGQLKVIIDHIYPLEQAALALEQVEHGHVRGKVVLSIV